MLNLAEIAGKAVGAAKAAKGALTGYRGIFRTLAREHGEVSVLLLRIATEKDPQARSRTFPLLVRKLLAHAQAEHLELYSILAEHESTRALVAHLEADHDRIEDLVADLSRMPLSSPAWLERFHELKRVVHDHVDREEHQVFPRARRILSRDLIDDIDRRYRLAITGAGRAGS